MYVEVVKRCQEIEVAAQKANIPKSSVSIDSCLKKLCCLEIESLSASDVGEVEPITYCLQPFLAVQITLNPVMETPAAVNQLLMIQKLKNYSNARLYCEIIRACLMCLHDTFCAGTGKESYWAAFTFLKVPAILKELHITLTGWFYLFFYRNNFNTTTLKNLNKKNIVCRWWKTRVSSRHFRCFWVTASIHASSGQGGHIRLV